jgi:hypothetical protein
MLLLGLGALPGVAQAQFCPGPGYVFIDVPDTDPMCPDITWIADRGITLGCAEVNGGQRLFCPANNVQRNQMAAFLQRLGESLFPLNCAANSVMQWNGTDWVCALATGPAGPAGPAGPQGPDGQQGPQGPAGPAGPDGAAGPAGNAGPQGPQGDAGPAGPAGPDGIQGPAGPAGKSVLNGTGAPTTEGVDGDFYIDTAASTIYGPKTAGAWGSGTSLIGPAGPAGADGAQGPVGATGAPGAPGATGATGAQGPQGAVGPQGNTGATGPVGAQGPVGATGPQGPAGSAITATPTVVVTGANNPYNVTASDYTVFCNVSSNDRTVNLPSASGNAGRIYVVRRVGSGNDSCSVTGVAGGTVILDNGITNTRRAVMVQSDGSSWWIIAESYN